MAVGELFVLFVLFCRHRDRDSRLQSRPPILNVPSNGRIRYGGNVYPVRYVLIFTLFSSLSPTEIRASFYNLRSYGYCTVILTHVGVCETARCRVEYQVPGTILVALLATYRSVRLGQSCIDASQC